ncbi:MAG: hypothetical protein ACLUD1_11915 [Clostridia bacterium]
MEKIKKWLPRGYAKIIRDKTGRSISYIYQVVSGTTSNNEVYNALLELAVQKKAEIEKRRKLIDTL